MNLNMEEKRKIAARVFFQDNQNDYEDYHEAATEFLNPGNMSDQFVEFVVEPLTKPLEGYLLFTRDDGHVIRVRADDGFLEPVTEMTNDEGELLAEQLTKASEEKPDFDDIGLLKAIGWKLIF